MKIKDTIDMCNALGVRNIANACGITTYAVYKWRNKNALPYQVYTGEVDYAEKISELFDNSLSVEQVKSIGLAKNRRLTKRKRGEVKNNIINCLKKYSDKSGKVEISLHELAGKSNCGISWAFKTLNALKDKKLIRVLSSKQTTRGSYQLSKELLDAK